MTDVTVPKTVLPRYRLRTLLLFVLIVGIGMGWFAPRFRRVQRQREVVDVVEKHGGAVLPSPGMFRDVEVVSFECAPYALSTRSPPEEFTFGDDELKYLQGLSNLRFLDLSHTKVSDAGLMNLEGLTNLKILILRGTFVTDEGVARLQDALPECAIGGHSS